MNIRNWSGKSQSSLAGRRVMSAIRWLIPGLALVQGLLWPGELFSARQLTDGSLPDGKSIANAETSRFDGDADWKAFLRFAVRNAGIQQDLQFTGSQLKRMADLDREFRLRQAAVKAQIVKEEADRDRQRELRGELESWWESIVWDEVLLPHQHNRLDQLFLQKLTARGEGFDTERVLRRLLVDGNRLTDKQLEEIRKHRSQAQAELVAIGETANEKALAVLQETRSKLLELLNADQRSLFDEIVGEPSTVRAIGGRGFMALISHMQMDRAARAQDQQPAAGNQSPPSTGNRKPDR